MTSGGAGGFRELLFMDYKPGITGDEFVLPGRALALRFLRHIAEPEHRFITSETMLLRRPTNSLR